MPSAEFQRICKDLGTIGETGAPLLQRRLLPGCRLQV